MAEQNEFDVKESLRILNELRTLTLENESNYFSNIDEFNSRIKEFKERGYKMILANNLEPVELSEPIEISDKYASEIKRIQLEKIEDIKNGRMENAARLRSQEKFLVVEVLNSYFGNPSIHYKLHNAEKKEVLCRPAFYKFQFPNLYFDLGKNPFKKVVNDIQKVLLDTPLYSVGECQSKLSTKSKGLYWIWTNHSDEDLKACITDEEKRKHVPISKLVMEREGLNNICKIEKDDFRIVYNGMGGFKKVPAKFSLRKRISQELDCPDKGTGTLNILNRFGSSKEEEKKNWRISFFEFGNMDNLKILSQLGRCGDYYNQYASTLEKLWRIEYGMPILIRH